MAENNNLKHILGFSLIPEVGPATFSKIKKHFKNLQDAWTENSSEIFVAAGISQKVAEKITAKKSLIDLDRQYEQCQCQQIAVIPKGTEKYPKLLNETSSAPFVLFCRGNAELLHEKQIAIVGSRNHTNYANLVLEKIIPDLGRAGLIVTSGLAQGVDSLAHRQALKNEIPTIAVLGSGIDDRTVRDSFFYPIFQEILENGSLVVSEYPVGFFANKFTFPARNRIISGLSLGTLVVEAAEKSGALITARHALEQNREVFAVPGNIFSPVSVGTNTLIKEGAKPVTTVMDIFLALNFHFEFSTSAKKTQFDDKIEELIYKILSFEPLHIDKIAKNAKLDTTTVSAKLSIMELSGLAKNIGGGMFIRS